MIYGEVYLEGKPDGAAFAVGDRDYLMRVSIGIGAVQRDICNSQLFQGLLPVPP